MVKERSERYQAGEVSRNAICAQAQSIAPKNFDCCSDQKEMKIIQNAGAFAKRYEQICFERLARKSYLQLESKSPEADKPP